ncbi:MAG TPA: threonine/serine dehydratase [Anaerolineae bacterium]|nr:threonine/serine dehydratase [Anaerolineae bacterium]
MMVDLGDVLAARQVVAAHAWRTPLVESPALAQRAGADVRLKLECWQRTGSFKVRGALARVAALIHEGDARELVTASAGNHGLGVAYAAQALGAPRVTIFVPETAPRAKLERLAAFDCELRREGHDYDTTHVLAEVYAHERGAFYLSAYDDPIVIAGQGTVGLEIVEELPEVDVVVVPIGGGGLIAGTAVAVRAANPAVRVVGVQPEASPAAYLSFRDGHVYERYDAGPTLCDGLAGGFGRVPFEVARDLVDEVLVVPEADVREAVRWLVAHEQIVVEGSGAIAVAPLLNGQLDAAGRKVVAVLTGRNIDAAVLAEILGVGKTVLDTDLHG